MYRIQTEARYWWPVTIRQPDPARPGVIAEQVLEAEFRWLTGDEHNAWLARAQEHKLPDSAAMLEICTSFRNVLQEDGTPLPTTPENVKRLLESDSAVALAFARAYFDSRAKAAEKN
jgi:hypothetical protein